MSILSAPGRPGQCQTVHEVIEMYLAQARRDLSARSYETVSCILGRFDGSAGQLTLAECRPFDLQCWLNEHPEYRSEWYRRCVISTIKRAFNWACEMELIHRNPFAKLRSRGRPQRRRPMTDDEFQTLLRSSDPTFRRFLIFLKFTGCRPGEAAGMRWADVHFEKGAVVLKEHKTARKTGRPRIIPLVPTVVRLLLWMRSVREDPSTCEQDHVFTNRRGNAFSRGWLSLKMQRLRRRLIRQPDGTSAWHVTNKIPLFDGTGAVIGTAGIARRLNASSQRSLSGIEFGPVLLYLRDNHHAAITNQQLARLAHMSVRAFERKFRSSFHRAAEIPAEPADAYGGACPSLHRPVAGQVASNCDFASQSHFSREFRRYFGRTPREYREHYALGKAAAPGTKLAAAEQ
jgi:integrase/AraC-like DNA-binding protein